MENNFELPPKPQFYDCTTCRWGYYNDMFDMYFCYYNSGTNHIDTCKNWDKWEKE